jgi:hypothetical protein
VLLSLVVLVNEEWKAKLLLLRGVELLENRSLAYVLDYKLLLLNLLGIVHATYSKIFLRICRRLDLFLCSQECDELERRQHDRN